MGKKAVYVLKTIQRRLQLQISRFLEKIQNQLVYDVTEKKAIAIIKYLMRLLLYIKLAPGGYASTHGSAAVRVCIAERVQAFAIL